MFVISKLRNLKHRLQEYLFSMPQYFIERYARIDARSHLSEDNKKLVHLTKEEKRQIKELFEPYYPKISMGWHDMFKEITGKFYPGYMPEDFIYTKIDTFYNDWQKGIQFDDKGYYDRIFSSAPFKLPVQICCKINGFWLDSDYKPISEDAAIRLMIDNGKAFLKRSVMTAEGFGIALFDATRFPDDDARIEFLKDKIKSIGNNIVVQEPIKQSPILSVVNQSSVNTIRVISFLKKDGTVKIYSNFIRFGRKGSIVDNGFHGGIACPIDIDGSLKDFGVSSKGEKFTHHPDSGVRFDSVRIPGFYEFIEKVKDYHPQFPNFRLISWDFAIDYNNQPVLIEFNIYCGGAFFNQILDGPPFGEDTIEILEEVFGKNRH